jgi:integrase
MWRENGEARGVTFADRAEAERWRQLVEANGGSFTKAEEVYEKTRMDGPTVAEAIQQHIDQLVDVTPYTVKRYREALRLHFQGPLGGLKVAGVGHSDIVDWVRWMQGRGLSPKTINNKHGLLSAAMLTQVRAGTIPRNPCAGVRLPKKRRVGDDGDDITMADYKAIRDRMDPHFQPFVDFLVGTGCRFSEATALMGKDFLLDSHPPLVLINKAHKLGGDENPARYIGDPKSSKSRRRVSLAPSTVNAVRPLVQQALLDGKPVFRMKDGGQFTAQAFYNRGWQKPRKAAGFGPGSEKNVTVHSIRHLHAAILLHAGMSMYELSARLGHNSIQMTVDLYSHLVPEAHFRGAEHAARALGEVPELSELGSGDVLPVDPADYSADGGLDDAEPAA